MIGCDDRIMNENEVSEIFNAKYQETQISHSTKSRVERIRGSETAGRPSIFGNKKLNVFSIEENPYILK